MHYGNLLWRWQLKKQLADCFHKVAAFQLPDTICAFFMTMCFTMKSPKNGWWMIQKKRVNGWLNGYFLFYFNFPTSQAIIFCPHSSWNSSPASQELQNLNLESPNIWLQLLTVNHISKISTRSMPLHYRRIVL